MSDKRSIVSSAIPSSRKRKRLTPPRLTIQTLDFSSPEHLTILGELGIVVEAQQGGRIQISHMMQKVGGRSPR